jgi:hypothetical protein
MYKRDLKNAYRQFHIDYAGIPKLGYWWQHQLYFNWVLPLGLKSSDCQQITNAVSFKASKSGLQVINYLDDFTSADTKQGPLKGFQHLA